MGSLFGEEGRRGKKSVAAAPGGAIEPAEKGSESRERGESLSRKKKIAKKKKSSRLAVRVMDRLIRRGNWEGFVEGGMVFFY